MGELIRLMSVLWMYMGIRPARTITTIWATTSLVPVRTIPRMTSPLAENVIIQMEVSSRLKRTNG